MLKKVKRNLQVLVDDCLPELQGNFSIISYSSFLIIIICSRKVVGGQRRGSVNAGESDEKEPSSPTPSAPQNNSPQMTSSSSTSTTTTSTAQSAAVAAPI